ncbi:MAG TPA: PEP-CTERM sorting domain-containing protein [Bryobacteraceae bacterium]|jgi:hypothetical protein
MRALLTLLFSVAVCQATPTFTVTFSPSTVSGPPGSVLGFTGTLLNNTASTVFINNDSFTLAGGIPLDDSPFFGNAPFSLGPNASSGPFLFFNVTIPALQAPNDYAGTFDVIGGADGNAQDNLGEGVFTVTVSSVPEPAPGLLVAAGLGAFLLLRRRLLWRAR